MSNIRTEKKERFDLANSALKDLFDAGLFRGEVRFEEPVSAHTSLRIGGNVEVMIFPEDPLSLKNVLLTAGQEGIPVIVIGAGTNILVSEQKIKGVAVSLREFEKVELTKETNDQNAVLYVGAGVTLPGLLRHAQKNGYSGLEALAGIPGSFGGSVHMNAGSFGTEIKDVIESVAVMSRQGELSILGKDKIEFSYRTSSLPEGTIIMSANIILGKDDPDEVTKRTKNFFEKKKAAQPLGGLSAGCVFKNPAGNTAGSLIDQAGCKGVKVGNVEVSKVHANYFINRGKATFGDFNELIEIVRTKVKNHSGITLEPEIKIIGERE